MRIYFWLIFILLLAFGLRIINLTSLPIFTDEAIYIRWTQIANQDPAHRFISLSDGKQPAFIWANIVSQRVFPDPLFAGRLVSVLSGVFACVGIFLAARELWGKKVAILAAAGWALVPFSLWHDRLAMMDSLLAAVGAWVLYLAPKLARNLKTDHALFLGFAIGAGLLTKTSAQFFIILLPASVLFLTAFNKKNLLKFIYLSFLAVLLGLVIDAVQRLSPFYYIVAQKSLTFLYSWQELAKFTLFEHWQRLWGNIYSLSLWTGTYLTLPVVFLIVFSLKSEKIKEKIYLLGTFLLPFLALSFFGKVIYPRFTLFMVLPLIILAAVGFTELEKLIKNRLLLPLFSILIFAYPIYFDSQIIFNFLNAPLPSVDRGQYLDDWPAGWGITETVAYLSQASRAEKIAVATEGTFGLTPYALEIYLWRNPNIEIKGFWPIDAGWEWINEKVSQKPTYLLLKDTQKPKDQWPVELVAKFKRGKGDNYLQLYSVNK